MFIRFTASAFRKLLSINVFSGFPFGFEGRMWDLIVTVPDHCLSFYFDNVDNVSPSILTLNVAFSKCLSILLHLVRPNYIYILCVRV